MEPTNPDNDYEAYEIKRQEAIERRRGFRCADGYCGADDCDRCRPGWQWNSKEDEEDA